MATTTTNYNLTKPDGTESADISVINDNMDVIDEALKGKADSGHTHSEYALKSEIPDISGKADTDHTHSEYATKAEIPDVSGFATKTELDGKSDSDHAHTEYASKSEIPDVSGKANLTGNQEFKGQIRITRDNGNVPLFVRAPNSEEVNIGLTNSSGTGYFGVDANLNPVYMGNEEPDQIALMSDIPNMSNYATKTALNNKQDKLTAGSGITIENNVISANVPNITISSAEPSGGSHGDIWFKYSESSSGGDSELPGGDPLPGGGGGL